MLNATAIIKAAAMIRPPWRCFSQMASSES